MILQLDREQESSETNSHCKAMNENNHDGAVKSNGSDCSYAQSVDDADSTLSLGEVETSVKLQHFHYILLPINISLCKIQIFISWIG